MAGHVTKLQTIARRAVDLCIPWLLYKHRLSSNVILRIGVLKNHLTTKAINVTLFYHCYSWCIDHGYISLPYTLLQKSIQKHQLKKRILVCFSTFVANCFWTSLTKTCFNLTVQHFVFWRVWLSHYMAKAISNICIIYKHLV